MRRREFRAIGFYLSLCALWALLLAAWPALDLTASVIIKSVFSTVGPANNTAMTSAAEGQNNTCNSLTEFQAGQGANFAANGLFGCGTAGSGSTDRQINGLFGAVNNAGTTTNGVAGYFSARAAAGGSGATDPTRVRVWAINPLLSDGNFNHVLLQNEFDFNVKGPDTHVMGMQFTGASTAAPTSDSRYVQFMPLGTGIQIPDAMECHDGATSDACGWAGPSGTGNNVQSQNLRFTSRDSGGVTHDGFVFLGPSGYLNLNAVTSLLGVRVLSAGAIQFTFDGSDHLISQSTSKPAVSACGTTPSVNGQATDFAGIITVGTGATTSCTLTFAVNFGNPPVCTVTNGSAIAAVQAATTISTLIITASASFASNKLQYVCIGTGA